MNIYIANLNFYFSLHYFDVFLVNVTAEYLTTSYTSVKAVPTFIKNINVTNSKISQKVYVFFVRPSKLLSYVMFSTCFYITTALFLSAM